MNYKTIDDDKMTLIVDGKEETYDLLLSFECKENGRTYICFNDGTEDEEGNANLVFASYDPNSESNMLYDITHPEEEEMINEVLMNLGINVENGEK